MEAVNLKSLEQLDDAFGGRMLALPALRVQRQFLEPSSSHASPQLPLQERVHQEGQEVATQVLGAREIMDRGQEVAEEHPLMRQVPPQEPVVKVAAHPLSMVSTEGEN
jgi:hypothetical protein